MADGGKQQTAPVVSTSDARHTIRIDRDGEWYRVRVLPPVRGFDFDQRKRDRRYIEGYARILGRQHGWPVEDQTEETGHG